MGPTPARRIRVVHLVLTLDVGGLERVVLDLLRAGDRSRIDPRVICLEGPGALAPRFEPIGVPVEALEAPQRPVAFIRLVRRLRALKPDLVHTHNPKPHYLAALARPFVGRPALLHTKHGRNDLYPPRTKFYNRLASLLTDLVVAVSADAAAGAVASDRVSGKVVVVHNGVDLSRLNPPGNRADIPPVRAVCVARLSVMKDHATLLRATRKVVDHRPDFRLELVGDGPERRSIEALRDELGLTPHVSLTGEVSVVADHLANADLFVLSSTSEGLSIAILEAMATGLAVVATDVGGNREIVVQGETGLLVPSRSADSLAGALLTLLDDPAMLRAMGRAGRRRVEAEFDLRRTTKRYEELYRGLVSRTGRTTPAAEP